MATNSNRPNQPRSYFYGHSGFSGATQDGPRLYRWEDFHPEEAAEIEKLRQEREKSRAKAIQTSDEIAELLKKQRTPFEEEEKRRTIEWEQKKKEASHRRWSRRLWLLALAFLLVCSLFGFLVHAIQ